MTEQNDETSADSASADAASPATPAASEETHAPTPTPPAAEETASALTPKAPAEKPMARETKATPPAPSPDPETAQEVSKAPAMTAAQEVLSLQGEINALIVKIKRGGRENEHRNNAVAHLQETFTALTRDLKLAATE